MARSQQSKPSAETFRKSRDGDFSFTECRSFALMEREAIYIRRIVLAIGVTNGPPTGIFSANVRDSKELLGYCRELNHCNVAE